MGEKIRIREVVGLWNFKIWREGEKRLVCERIDRERKGPRLEREWKWEEGETRRSLRGSKTAKGDILSRERCQGMYVINIFPRTISWPYCESRPPTIKPNVPRKCTKAMSGRYITVRKRNEGSKHNVNQKTALATSATACNPAITILATTQNHNPAQLPEALFRLAIFLLDTHTTIARAASLPFVIIVSMELAHSAALATALATLHAIFNGAAAAYSCKTVHWNGRVSARKSLK